MQLANVMKLLSSEQLQSLENDLGQHKWSSTAIISGLKLQYVLGLNGYKYLRTNYPTPSYCTLNKRIQHIKIDFGIFSDIIDPLQTKVSAIENHEKAKVKQKCSYESGSIAKKLKVT